MAAAVQIDTKRRLDALNRSIVGVLKLLAGQYFARDEVSANVEKHFAGDASRDRRYPDVIRVPSTHLFDPDKLRGKSRFLHIRKAIVPIAGSCLDLFRGVARQRAGGVW